MAGAEEDRETIEKETVKSEPAEKETAKNGMAAGEIKDYQAAEHFLYELPKFTSKNSLEHTAGFLERMGNPGQAIPKIHVAGTNGKGSVCAYLQSLLKEKGCKTGGFISPHLVTMHERFLIDGQPVDDNLFMESFGYVKRIADAARKEGCPYPTFFEFLFLMGMYIFEQERVEVLVLETGLGGRLDATNVFDRKDVCVITSIGLDHCKYLGNTKEEIAGEKAGIIKNDTVVIYPDKEQCVSAVIEEKCTKMSAISVPLIKKEYSVEKIKHKSIDFSYKSRYYNYISLTASTNALYQAENAALALRAFEVFEEKHNMTPVSVDKIRKAIADTVWEGRMEEVFPDVYFDGAHNENGIEAFLQSVAAMETKGKRILCFSAVEDKDYGQMISMLGESGLFSRAAVVEMEDARGTTLAELEEYFSQYDCWDVRYMRGAEEGLKQCLLWKNPEDAVFIVGSLYLVGCMKAVLRRKQHDQF